MNNRIKFGMLLICAVSMSQINADNNSWFSGWGAAIRNMSTSLWGSASQSPIIKKNKEKIAGATVAAAGTGLGLWAGWYYWFKKPKVEKLKAELLTAEVDFEIVCV